MGGWGKAAPAPAAKGYGKVAAAPAAKGWGKAAAAPYAPAAKGWGKDTGKGWGKDSGKGWGKDSGKGKGKRPKADPETTAWIGGLPANEASTDRNKALLEHMKQAGNCKYVKIGNSGTGSTGFTSNEEVQNAIATLNGSEFQGSIIEVDVWTKMEKTD